MNTKDQSDEAQELRVLANALENGGELSRSERRTVANALRATPDHAALVEALELCIDVMTWEHRQRDPKFKPEDATPESAIGRARTALSTLSKAPQAGEDADPAEVMDDFIRAVLADNMPRTDEPYRTVAKWVRRLKPFPSSRAEPVAWQVRLRNGSWQTTTDPTIAHDWCEHAAKYREEGYEVRPLYASPPSSRAEVEAYVAGATAVHNEWVAAHDRDEGPPHGEPDFTEAASDYAAAIRALAQPAVGRDGR